MAEFKIGDTVRLKSGGPSMTISGKVTYATGVTSDTDWYCIWFENNKKFEDSFHQDTLELDED